uniref:Uncharacterized protein n=1 Tax=Tetraselmis sp. GSL018 TaxID=582737 RepID=A0A061R934_9CHLO
MENTFPASLTIDEDTDSCILSGEDVLETDEENVLESEIDISAGAEGYERTNAQYDTSVFSEYSSFGGCPVRPLSEQGFSDEPSRSSEGISDSSSLRLGDTVIDCPGDQSGRGTPWGFGGGGGRRQDPLSGSETDWRVPSLIQRMMASARGGGTPQMLPRDAGMQLPGAVNFDEPDEDRLLHGALLDLHRTLARRSTEPPPLDYSKEPALAARLPLRVAAKECKPRQRDLLSPSMKALVDDDELIRSVLNSLPGVNPGAACITRALLDLREPAAPVKPQPPIPCRGRTRPSSNRSSSSSSSSRIFSWMRIGGFGRRRQQIHTNDG